MSDLKPGDTVECVDTFGSQARAALTRGGTYTVRDVSESGLVSIVGGEPYVRWRVDRFRKVDPVPSAVEPARLQAGDRVRHVDVPTRTGTVFEVGLGSGKNIARVGWDQPGPIKALVESRLLRLPAPPAEPVDAGEVDAAHDQGYVRGLADAVAWLRRDGVPTTAARLRQAVDDGHFTSPPPLPALPTEPGYYLAPDAFPSPLVVELLNSPPGQWVDNGDRTYLETANVAKLGRLDRLERRADTATRLLQRRLDLGGHRDEVIDERVAREFGVHE